MPIFGEPSRFAIEFELNDDFGGVWMFGRICYWVGGLQIGDYELGASLRDGLFELDQVAKGSRYRISPRFRSMSASSAFELIDGVLYATNDLFDTSIAEEEQWAWHNIIPSVDVFGGWKGFLLDDGKTARLIFAHDPYVKIQEISFCAGEVDFVIDAARGALNDIYERESGKSH